MKLYAGTTEQFRTDTQLHRIAEKLRAEYVAQIGYKPGPAEFAAWQNSLTALSMLVDQAELSDHGVILEYQLGNTSKRLDAMLTGRSSTSAENAVVVELKQWGTTAPSPADGCVETFVGQGIRRVLQVGRRLLCELHFRISLSMCRCSAAQRIRTSRDRALRESWPGSSRP